MKTDIDESKIGTCENCHREKVRVRSVKAYGAFGSGDRGFYDFCFRCFAPQEYVKGRDGRIYSSPMKLTDEQLRKLDQPNVTLGDIL